MNAGKKIIVIGCGIAGPAVSLFLQRAGIEASIFESQHEPDTHAGAFLNIMPNGLRVLKILGVLDHVLQAGHSTNSFSFIREDGRNLGHLDLSGVPSYEGTRSILIERGLLNKILRDSAMSAGIPIAFGKKLADLRQVVNGDVRALFMDGTEVRGSAVLGCDGVHSHTRRLLLPDTSGPRYNGLMNAGSVLKTDILPPSTTMTMMFGRKAFFGYQSVPTGEVYWFSNFAVSDVSMSNEWARTNADMKERIESLYDASPHPIPEIIGSIDHPIGVWPTYDLSSLPSWCSRRVCLVGDAAHAASPSAGSGASLALEDSLVLARCMRDSQDFEEAFKRYEQLRKPRTDWVVRQARRNDRQKLVANPLAIRLRDLLMPIFFKFGDRAMSRIYSYEVDW